MKYALVSFTNINVLPYASKYIKSILANGNSCDLIFWDKDAKNGDKEAEFGCQVICYNCRVASNSALFEKLKGYLGAIWHINYWLLHEGYDRVVFLETHSAVTSFIPVSVKYRGRFVIEIRDFTYENNAVYRLFEKAVIARSMQCIISSEAYRRFLPAGNYLLAHNITRFNREQLLKAQENIGFSAPYTIAFVGTVRFIDQNKKLLKVFANNQYFVLAYYGSGSETLKEYCEQQGIDNVLFRGRFSQRETLEQYKNVAVINNVYGNNSPYLDFALSNKLYHAAQLRIPILVSPGTYMEEVTKKYGIGYTFDVSDSKEPYNLLNWLNSIDRSRFVESCARFLSQAEREMCEYTAFIERFSDQGYVEE